MHGKHPNSVPNIMTLTTKQLILFLSSTQTAHQQNTQTSALNSTTLQANLQLYDLTTNQIIHLRQKLLVQKNQKNSPQTRNTVEYRGPQQQQTWTMSPARLNMKQQMFAAAWDIIPPTTAGAWGLRLIQTGTVTLDDTADTYTRMMTLTGVKTPNDVTANHILQYLHGAQTTCKGRTLCQYLGHILGWGQRLNLEWANSANIQTWELMRRGLRKEDKIPPVHATPMTPDLLMRISERLGHDATLQLALQLAFQTGSRMDEIFRITKNMIYVVPRDMLSKELQRVSDSRTMKFVIVETRTDSKTGQTDPDDLRFVDVALCSQAQMTTLLNLMNSRRDDPLFTARDKLSRLLREHDLSDHSCKAGAALILTSLIKDELLPIEVLPLYLKHKRTVDPIQSVTAGYIHREGRINLLQAKKVFTAAIMMRTIIYRDI